MGVTGRLLGAMIVPILLLVAVSVGITSERRDRVEVAERTVARMGVLEQLAELRSAVFAERVAAELLVDRRRPVPEVLAMSELGTILLERPGDLAARTDAAVLALPAAERPFEVEEVRAARVEPGAWSSTIPGVRRQLHPFFERTTEAMQVHMDRVLDAAVRLDDAELLSAGRAFHRAVPVPQTAGELLAELTDLWVAGPSTRPQRQSRVAQEYARLDEHVDRFLDGLARDHELRGYWHDELEMPEELAATLRGALRGDLSSPDRHGEEPAEVGLALLEGVDWLIEVEDLPLLAARDVALHAGRVGDAARTEELATAAALLVAVAVSIALAMWFGRSIIAPVLRLTDRAQRVGSGRLDSEPLPLKGPPEVVRACHAFNDVVDNLLLLEKKSHALADCDFDHPALRQPLPGLLGAELQRSVRVLSGSIVEREQLQSRLVYEATHDALTGLSNRAELVERITTACRERRDGESVAVVFIDLDGFKRANDRYGHAAGDELLRVVARRLRQLAPVGSTVARFGGDEFVVVVPGAPDLDAPVALAHEMVDAVSEPVEIEGTLLSVGASAGVALSGGECHGEGGDPLDLLRRADLAVYSAKRSPTIEVAVYDGDLDRRILHQEDVERSLRSALEPGGTGLTLVYQPIIDTATGELHGVESLVRWDRPEHGRVPPDAFVPIAERSSLIMDLDRWVLRAALAQLSRWERSPQLRGVPVSVNVSGRTLGDPNFVEHVTAALAESGVAPGQLKLEVTETALVTDLEMAGEQLRTIQALGVRVVIDDFGTGYTSVAHLRSMPVDELKIDGSFVQRLAQDEDRVLIQMIHQLAQHLQIPTVAECVETAEQIRVLREIGCEALQGYLFSPPLDPDELERWVRARLGGWDLGGFGTDTRPATLLRNGR